MSTPSMVTDAHLRQGNHAQAYGADISAVLQGMGYPTASFSGNTTFTGLLGFATTCGVAVTVPRNKRRALHWG